MTTVIEPTVEEILARFVGKNDIRAYLNKPFALGGFVYSCNGHIAVRVPETEKVSATDGSEIKGVSGIAGLFDSNKLDNYTPLPPLPELPPCQACEGTGRVKEIECYTCDGEGEFEHDDHWYDCKTCDETGRIESSDGEELPCDDCDGTGKNQSVAVPVGAYHFNAKYLAKLVDLPAIRFNVPQKGVSDYCMAYFTFYGGEGVLMSMRP